MRYLALLLITLSSLILSGCLTAAGSAAAGGLIIYKRHEIESAANDVRIESEINNAYFSDEELWENNRIIVTSMDGNVLLMGEARTPALRDKAVTLAQQVPGIQKLYNQITLGTPVSLLQQTKDAAITMIIKTKMMFAENFDPSAVKVVTNDNIVYLLGVVTPKIADQASSIASQSLGVKKVVKVFQYIT